MILLPTELCRAGDTAALRFALMHEWSHVERRDLGWWHLATFGQCLFFYQPLLWRLRRQLRLCQDFLADARAARLADDNEQYADFLLGLARARLQATPAVLGVADRRSNLYQRVKMLVEDATPVEPNCSAHWNWTCGLAAVLLLTAVSALRLDAEQSKASDSAQAVGANRANGASVKVLCVDSDGKPVAGAEVHLFQGNEGEAARYLHFGPFTSDEQGRVACEHAVFRDKHGHFDRWIYARVPGRLIGAARMTNWKNHLPRNSEGRVQLEPATSVEGLVEVPAGFDPTETTVRVETLHIFTGPGDFDFEGFTREDHFPGLDTALPEIFERHPDAEGRFRFSDVPKRGRLYLLIRGKGLAEAQWRNDNNSFDQPRALPTRGQTS